MGEDIQQKVNTLTAFDLEVRGVLNMMCVYGHVSVALQVFRHPDS